MAMSHAHQGRYQQNALPQRKRNLLWTPVAVFAAGILGAVILIAWLLWPRWPSAEMSLDAPSLPVTVNGVNFRGWSRDQALAARARGQRLRKGP